MLRPISVCTREPACSCEVARTVRKNIHAEYVMEFVKGTNDSFEAVRSRALTTTPLPDINMVFNMAITHERQQSCAMPLPKLCVSKEMLIVMVIIKV